MSKLKEFQLYPLNGNNAAGDAVPGQRNRSDLIESLPKLSLILRGHTTTFLYVLLLLPLLTIHPLQAQLNPPEKIEILLDSLKKVTDKEQRIKLLNLLSETCFTVNPDLGIKYGKESLKLGLTHNNPVLVAIAYHHIAGNYYFKNDYIQAIHFYWSELKWSEQHKLEGMTGKSYHGIAVTYFNQKNYEKSIVYFKKALAQGQKTNDHDLKIGCTANLAMAYEAQNRLEDALGNYEACLTMAVEAKNKNEEGYMQARIGWVYYLMGNYEKALNHQFQSYAILKQLTNPNNTAAVLGELSSTYRSMLNFPKAEEYLLKSIAQLAPSNTSLSLFEKSMTCISLGNLYLDWRARYPQQSDNEDARRRYAIKSRDYFRKSIELSLKTTNRNSLSLGYEGLSKAYEALNSPSEALGYYKKHIAIRDSLTTLDQEKESARQELEYSFQKRKDSMKIQSSIQQARFQKLEKEKKIADLAYQKQWLYGIIIFTSLVFSLTLTYYILKSKQQRLQNDLALEKKDKALQQSEMQQKIRTLTFKAIHSQMNPHFLFNTLNTIQHYVFANEKERAVDYLGKFSHLFRQILAFSNSNEVTLNEEIEMIRVYVDLENARFKSSILFDLEIDNTIDLEAVFIPPLIIQPFVENAIKHGLMHSDQIKKLQIKISRSDDPQNIFVHVIDNGIGRIRSKALQGNHQPENHASFAMEANAQRLDLLSPASDNRERLRILDRLHPDGSPAGTEIILEIPL